MALIECPECGRMVSERAATCPECACTIAEPRAPERIIERQVVTKETQAQGSGGNVVAAVASFFIPGLGQLTQGRVGRGVLHFFAAMFMWVFLLGWMMHLVSCVNAANWKPDR